MAPAFYCFFFLPYTMKNVVVYPERIYHAFIRCEGFDMADKSLTELLRELKGSMVTNAVERGTL